MQNWITELEMEMFEDFIWIDPTTDCYIWQGSKSPNGYGVISIGGKPISTHRLSWLLSREEDPTGLYVCHTCDVKLCCNPSHLFLGTAKQNSEDAVAKGRFKRDFHSTPRRISATELEIMVARYQGGETWYRIGLDMNWPQQLVKRRVEGIIYGDIFEFLDGFAGRLAEQAAA